MRTATTIQRTLPLCLPAALISLLLLAACGVLGREAVVIDRTGDPGLVRQVEMRLAQEPAIDASRIRVEANGGMILLYGSVDGLGQWRCAIRNAQLVEGVSSVVDYLAIERGPRDITCAAPRDSS